MARFEISRPALALPLPAGPGAARDLPDPVQDVLFAGRGTVFAVLDGGRIRGLPERLAALDPPRACLFSGDMAQEADEMAPWLVELSPDSPLLRQMLCDVPDDTAAVHGLMRKGPGIFLRTGLTLEALRTHLRRFMRVVDVRNRPFYFRFWEPEAAAVYFDSIAARPDMVTRWICPREGTGRIEALLIPTWMEGAALVRITPQDLPPTPPAARGSFTLSAEDVAALSAMQWRRDQWHLVERLRATFPDRAQEVGQDLPPLVTDMVERLAALGFRRRDMLFTFCAWALHYGADVLEQDPEGTLTRIIAQPIAVEERFSLIAARMDVLETRYFA